MQRSVKVFFNANWLTIFQLLKQIPSQRKARNINTFAFGVLHFRFCATAHSSDRHVGNCSQINAKRQITIEELFT